MKASGPLALVAGLALGFGVGVLLRPAAAVDPIVDAQPTPVAPVAPASAPREPIQRAKPDVKAPPVDRPRIPVPTGTGVIRGSVRLADGTPLPGVAVKARIEAIHAQAPMGPPASLEAEIEAAVSAVRRRFLTTRRVVTGDEGRYTLDRLEKGPYRVTASRSGFQIEPVDADAAREARPGDHVDFVARASVVVRFRVRDSHGVAPARATVLLRRGPGKYAEVVHRLGWSPGRPELRVEAGTWWAEAEVRTDAGARGARVALRAFPGDAPPQVELEVGSLPGLRGQVVAPSDWTANGARVLGNPFAGSEPPRYRNTVGAWSTARLSGRRFHFAAPVRPGPWAVVLADRRGKVLASTVARVGDGVSEVELVVGAQDTQTYRPIIVRGLEAVSDQRVRFGFEYAGPGGVAKGPVDAIEPSSGGRLADLASALERYLLPGKGPRAYQSGSYVLIARHAERGEKRVPFDPASEAPIDVLFATPGDYRVHLRGAGGTGLEMQITMHLVERPPPRGIILIGDRQAAVKGVVHWKGRQPQRTFARLMVSRPGALGNKEQFTLVCREIEFRPDRPEFDIELPTLHEVRVELKGSWRPHERASLLRVDPEDRWHHSTIHLADGRGRIPFVPSGTYVVVVRGEGGERRSGAFQVRADRAVTVDMGD